MIGWEGLYPLGWLNDMAVNIYGAQYYPQPENPTPRMKPKKPGITLTQKPYLILVLGVRGWVYGWGSLGLYEIWWLPTWALQLLHPAHAGSKEQQETANLRCFSSTEPLTLGLQIAQSRWYSYLEPYLLVAL